MINKRVLLTDDFPMLHSNAAMDLYVQTVQPEFPIVRRPAVVIFPGGGYEFCSQREAEPVALALAARGYQCFVVWYSVSGPRFPQQLLEAAAAVATVRRHAEEWNVDPERVYVMGFSAGGHLAGSVSTLFNEDVVLNTLSLQREQARPDKAVLCYPVITMTELTHEGSAQNLLGPNRNDAVLIEKTSLCRQVTDRTPPMFLWTTYEDGAVPCENSMMMASALRQQHIPFELHIYAEGDHGMSLCNAQVYSTEDMQRENPVRPRIARWLDDADAWLQNRY